MQPRTLAFVATFLAAVVTGSAFAQNSGELSPKQALVELRRQLDDLQVQQCSPAVDKGRGIEDATWLINRFDQVGWSKIPTEYVESLRLLAARVVDIKTSSDGAARCRAAQIMMADLSAKRSDCRVFGHARTNVNVQITTTSGGVPQDHWLVFAVWLPEGDRFAGVPRQLSSPSSPAKGVVRFAGEYEVFAKHPTNNTTTPPVRVSIGGSDPFVASISVPASKPGR